MKADLKDFSESSGDELENSSLSEHSDWSDNDDDDAAAPSSAKILKLTDEQREKLKETQNLLRKNVF